MRRALAVIYSIQKWLWRVLRPRTQGVKLLLFDRWGDVVLIRNKYGQTDLFLLPGGGIRFRETPAQAAIREAKEELGYDISAPMLVGEYRNEAEGKRDTIYLFRAAVDDPPNADGIEVAEAGLFPVENLPDATSPATRRRIDEHLRRREPDGEW
jgi:8-oxo-dGTP pyrophosphatase MutT (NUDIX family)